MEAVPKLPGPQPAPPLPAGLSPILVCFAVKEEAAPFQRRLGATPGIRVLTTGMGRRNAEQAVGAALDQQRPGLVVTSGFAGGLLPGLARGTVVFDPGAPPGLADRLVAAGARPARFHCAERVVTSRGDKRALRAASDAEAVEMESHFIQRLCQTRGIPAATVRVILDTAEEDLVLDFNQFMTPDQRIDGWKLALALLRSPARIPALLAFRKQTLLAAQCLGQTLARVLGIS